MTSTASLPDIVRADAGLVLMSEWTVGTPERQQAATAAAMSVWDHLAWPDGLLSYSCLTSTDGDTLLHYSQWTDAAAHAGFKRSDPPERVQQIFAEVPGIERHGVVEYQRYRSLVLGDGRSGCVVAVSFETDGHETARHFVDTLLDEQPGLAQRTDVEPPAGMLANHFHISADGTRVVNYAEFADEDAHRRIVASDLRDGDDVPQLISTTPGLRLLGFKRFHRWRTR
ncbi:antibiotic biosynthesis monooxygenase [Saccharopolyspora sp. NPDC050642]|uniref:antibiotic biosynthesis monooxygenase n=1 Tax=Saccharopolyspora sp. NPDC050642 TaxID=3157099 RepID=UPI0034012C56